MTVPSRSAVVAGIVLSWLAVVGCGAVVGYRLAAGVPWEVTTYTTAALGLVNLYLLAVYYPARLRAARQHPDADAR